MSKKDKSKFRKRIKTEILKQMQISGSVPQKETSQVVQTTINKETITPVEKSAPVADLDNIKKIKTDLKKSAIIITSIIIIMVALYFIDLKTNFLTEIGTQIF